MSYLRKSSNRDKLQLLQNGVNYLMKKTSHLFFLNVIFYYLNIMRRYLCTTETSMASWVTRAVHLFSVGLSSNITWRIGPKVENLIVQPSYRDNEICTRAMDQPAYFSIAK